MVSQTQEGLEIESERSPSYPSMTPSPPSDVLRIPDQKPISTSAEALPELDISYYDLIPMFSLKMAFPILPIIVS